MRSLSLIHAWDIDHAAQISTTDYSDRTVYMFLSYQEEKEKKV